MIGTRDIEDRLFLKINVSKHTRAVRAFFKANPAALRMCNEVVSSTSTDESINMYWGWCRRRVD